MPVRGRGWYKRPYRIKLYYKDGKVSTRCFHWWGPWKEAIDFYTKMMSQLDKIEVWVVADEQGNAQTTKRRENY